MEDQKKPDKAIKVGYNTHLTLKSLASSSGLSIKDYLKKVAKEKESERVGK
jgi:hypothetical protein